MQLQPDLIALLKESLSKPQLLLNLAQLSLSLFVLLACIYPYNSNFVQYYTIYLPVSTIHVGGLVMNIKVYQVYQGSAFVILMESD